MAHLIDKDALVAEIEKLYDEAPTCDDSRHYVGKVLDIIDTLEVKEVDIEGKRVWLEVDGFNHPNANKNKVYCVQTKYKLLLAKVIGHPHDDELLQWKCTEFPFHRYDMREGDKYFEVQL